MTDCICECRKEAAEEQRTHEIELAKIEAKKSDFQRAPIISMLRDWGSNFLGWVSLAAIIFLMAQCACEGCML